MPIKGSWRDACRCEVFAALAALHSYMHAVTNAFIRDGGGRQHIAPPQLQSLWLKWNVFPPREAGQEIPECDLRNALLIPVRLPLHLTGRIPDCRGLVRCRGGPSHWNNATGKRGDAEGTPPQTLVFVFLDVVPIFHVVPMTCCT